MEEKKEELNPRGLLDKSIKKWQELTKAENKVQVKPVVEALPPPPSEA